jgi:EmrB/QacA subfamily drug resistance transporter
MNDSARKPGPRSAKWLVLALVSIGTLMSTLDASIVSVAMPTLTAAFHTTVSTSQWFVLAYTSVVTVLLLAFGKLGDIVGRRRLYLCGILAFTAGSLVCGFSVSALMLILARGFQAVGASMIMSSGPALVTDAFPPEERGKSLGFIGSAVALGLLAGPLAGGVIIQYLSWHWMFFINVPIGLVLAAILATRVRGLDESRDGRLDIAGAGLMAIALAALLAGLMRGQDSGWLSHTAIALLVTALAFGAAFIVLERRASDPVLRLSLFRHRDFAVGAISGWANYAATFPIPVFVPFYLQNILGYDPRRVGLVLAFGPLTLALVAPLAGSLSDRIGPRLLTFVGLSIASAGLLSLRTLDPGSSMVGVVWRLVLASLGSAIFVSPNSSSVMGSVAREELGVAAGVVALVRNLGMVCGIALAGSIITTVERGFTATGEIGRGAAFRQLAFLEGLRAALLVCAAIALAGALVSALRVRPYGADRA